MNHLIAKIKGQGTIYKKILSEKTIYNLPETLEDSVPYSPNCNLNEDQWFIIENFMSKDFCLDILRCAFNSTSYDDVINSDMDKVDFICSYQENLEDNSKQYYFQKITPSGLLRKKIISFGEIVEFIENTSQIIIKNLPDAIYISNEDKLYFKALSAITSIFKGIDMLYREATTPEVDAFLMNDFITLTDGFSTENVKIPNRRRIALAQENLSHISPDERTHVFEYISEYCPNLNFEGQTFEIGSEENLKALLYGIGQRYYTTPVGNEKRLANSIITLP